MLTALLMRRALEYTAMCGMPVIDHCEDPTLKGDGVAHEGLQCLAARACKGIPGEAEELWIERDITLAGLTGGRFHVAHLSTRGSLRAVRDGKARGIAVTCEVAPHHFILTDDALEGYDTNVKMNPPLREAADRDELIRGLVDGSVDVIATDHAPHHADEKRVEFDRAPFGIVGLETCVPLTFDRLVHPGLITLTRFVELLSVNPARILGVAGGALTPGAVADVIDPGARPRRHHRSGAARLEVEEHAVRRLVAEGRRRRHHRRRPRRLHQPGRASRPRLHPRVRRLIGS